MYWRVNIILTIVGGEVTPGDIFVGLVVGFQPSPVQLSGDFVGFADLCSR